MCFLMFSLIVTYLRLTLISKFTFYFTLPRNCFLFKRLLVSSDVKLKKQLTGFVTSVSDEFVVVLFYCDTVK